MADLSEVHMFSEISRLAKEIFKFKFGFDAKYDKQKLKNYERELRIRLENGEQVPGYKAFVCI